MPAQQCTIQKSEKHSDDHAGIQCFLTCYIEPHVLQPSLSPVHGQHCSLIQDSGGVTYQEKRIVHPYHPASSIGGQRKCILTRPRYPRIVVWITALNKLLLSHDYFWGSHMQLPMRGRVDPCSPWESCIVDDLAWAHALGLCQRRDVPQSRMQVNHDWRQEHTLMRLFRRAMYSWARSNTAHLELCYRIWNRRLNRANALESGSLCKSELWTLQIEGSGNGRRWPHLYTEYTWEHYRFHRSGSWKNLVQ